MIQPIPNVAFGNFMTKTAETCQTICGTISNSFRQAQLDPIQAAKIKDLAARLQAIKDLNA